MRDILLERSQAYQQVFKGEYAEKVLADLERFTHANSTPHVPGDSHGTAQLEGRRQVWLRVQGYLHLPLADVGEIIETAEVED